MKLTLQQSSGGHFEKNRRVLDENISVTSMIRGFRTKNHAVATYEQIEKTLSLARKNCREGWNRHRNYKFVKYLARLSNVCYFVNFRFSKNTF